MGKTAAARASEKRRVARQKADAREGIIRPAAPQGGGRARHGGGGDSLKAIRRALESGDLGGALSAYMYVRAPLSEACTQQLIVACTRQGQLAAAHSIVAGCADGGGGGTPLPLGVYADVLKSASQLAGSAAMCALADALGPFISFPRGAASRTHFLHFSRLVVMEFFAEAEAAIEGIRSRSPRALASAGLALLDVRAQPLAAGGQLALTSMGGSQFPLARGRELSKGDSLLLSHMGPSGAALLDPTSGAAFPPFEAEVTSTFPVLTVKLHAGVSGAIPLCISSTPLRADRLASRITAERQFSALVTLANGPMDEGVRAALCPPYPGGAGAGAGAGAGGGGGASYLGGLLPPTPASIARDDLVVRTIGANLNPSQRSAVRAGLSNAFTLVLGPPGTGKTHTAVALIQAWIFSGVSPVLASGDSNTAVDNLLDGLARAGVRVVRVGRPESIRPELLNLSLDALGGPGMPRDEVVRLQKGALKRAQVVCATCSGAASAILDGVNFGAVLVDESSQATEPAVLVPLTFGTPRQVALFGDNRQLPPTIISRAAEAGGLSVSLFDRLATRGDTTAHLLDTQYRMHAALSAFPSAAFYGSALRTGVPSSARMPPRGFPWPFLRVPLAFMPVNDGVEAPDGTSHINAIEAARVASIVSGLVAAGEVRPIDIGVITPYASQVRVLRQALGGSVDVSSVDGYQGREKEVIVFSAVRANARGSIGFLADKRRVNVMLTRARRGLIVCGHTGTLQADASLWGPWLQWVVARGLMCGAAASDPSAAAALEVIDADPSALDMMRSGGGGAVGTILSFGSSHPLMMGATAAAAAAAAAVVAPTAAAPAVDSAAGSAAPVLDAWNQGAAGSRFSPSAALAQQQHQQQQPWLLQQQAPAHALPPQQQQSSSFYQAYGAGAGSFIPPLPPPPPPTASFTIPHAGRMDNRPAWMIAAERASSGAGGAGGAGAGAGRAGGEGGGGGERLSHEGGLAAPQGRGGGEGDHRRHRSRSRSRGRSRDRYRERERGDRRHDDRSYHSERRYY